MQDDGEQGESGGGAVLGGWEVWCHGPAGVNDSLRWRPGPTLCGNRQSRSECTGGREGGGAQEGCLESSGNTGTPR